MHTYLHTADGESHSTLPLSRPRSHAFPTPLHHVIHTCKQVIVFSISCRELSRALLHLQKYSDRQWKFLVCVSEWGLTCKEEFLLRRGTQTCVEGLDWIGLLASRTLDCRSHINSQLRFREWDGMRRRWCEIVLLCLCFGWLAVLGIYTVIAELPLLSVLQHCNNSRRKNETEKSEALVVSCCCGGFLRDSRGGLSPSLTDG